MLSLIKNIWTFSHQSFKFTYEWSHYKILFLSSGTSGAEGSSLAVCSSSLPPGIGILPVLPLPERGILSKQGVPSSLWDQQGSEPTVPSQRSLQGKTHQVRNGTHPSAGLIQTTTFKTRLSPKLLYGLYVVIVSVCTVNLCILNARLQFSILVLVFVNQVYEVKHSTSLTWFEKKTTGLFTENNALLTPLLLHPFVSGLSHTLFKGGSGVWLRVRCLVRCGFLLLTCDLCAELFVLIHSVLQSR